jgi:dipeptidyl aminopeptidase/acylaminoacyl peptidase
MIFYILFALIFFIGFLSFWGFWQAAHPPKIVSNLTPKELGWDFEEVSLKTEDGVTLSAWFIPTENKTNKTIILLHGYPADKGDLLRWSTFLKNHYNLFFFDFRYFGKSEGSYTSLGFHERKDVLAAIKYLKTNEIDEIGLMGFSFGASVALLTLPETSDVGAVVADSAFANLDLMGKTYYGNIPLLQKPLTILTKAYGRLIYGIKVDEITPEVAVKKTETPIFIIHSRQDELVLLENAERLKEALGSNQNSQVWIYDRGVHGELGSSDYQEKILQFFEKHLRPSSL